MGATIDVSAEFHEWLEGRTEDDESMEEALRRLLAIPEPVAVANPLSRAEVERAIEATDNLQTVDRDRLEVARETFSDDGRRPTGNGDEED